MNTWEEITEILSTRLTKQSFDNWFKSTKLFSENENEIQIAVPNKFLKDWIETHYSDLLNDVIENLDFQKNLSFRVDHKFQDKEPLQDPVLPEMPSPKTSVSLEEHVPAGKGISFLNERFTFENFVVGPSNQFAHAAARAVGEVLYKAYNPLFIYGGVGLGKTHLMHAIGHHVHSVNKQVRICFVSTEHFMNEMISCIRYDRMAHFRQKYRNMDVLMVDDIQFLSDKERTQEEFFHTFNALYDARKQLVFSSDRYPKEIPNLEERLRSRFEWGLLADIQPPDLETKVAILRKKAEIDGIHLPDDVSLFLAKKIRSNVRELEGSLIKLGAVASLTSRDISVGLAQEVLKDFLNEKEKIVSIALIQRFVVEHYKVKIADLKSKKRNQSIVLPRQVAMYLCRNLTDSSLPEIGKNFGGKDHTTVIHACKNIDTKIKTNPELANTIQQLKDRVLSN
ncbi:MAG: chromosomal replication initiator protein DnaA [Deltaproteobacteria bacterium]|nr:chromosomal replication initiator protein DnaA [Deltaproteobacteria bacterium]